MLVKTYCAAVNGMEVTTVTVEVSITRGVMFHLTGLADVAVKESHDRIAAALLNNGYSFPVADITANLAPADLRKEGSSFDLPSRNCYSWCNRKNKIRTSWRIHACGRIKS